MYLCACARGCVCPDRQVWRGQSFGGGQRAADGRVDAFADVDMAQADQWRAAPCRGHAHVALMYSRSLTRRHSPVARLRCTRTHAYAWRGSALARHGCSIVCAITRAPEVAGNPNRVGSPPETDPRLTTHDTTNVPLAGARRPGRCALCPPFIERGHWH